MFITIGYAALLKGSAPFRPDSLADDIFIARSEHQTGAGLKVRASVLGPEESLKSFGENLARYIIQPLWLSVENNTDEFLYLLPVVTDPAYCSPYEVSYRFHGLTSRLENTKRDSFFCRKPDYNDSPSAQGNDRLCLHES